MNVARIWESLGNIRLFPLSETRNDIENIALLPVN